MTDPLELNRRSFLQESLIFSAAFLLPGLGRGAEAGASASRGDWTGRHPVSKAHPRLLGTREELLALSRTRATEYQRLKSVAGGEGDDYSWIISAALVACIEGDAGLAQKVRERAMKLVTGPIRVGHVPFGTDLALCGLAFDLCREAWSDDDTRKLCEYINKTVDGNVESETTVFHNAWYGYKNWGIGLAAYATFHENDRAPAMLRVLEQDYLTRAAPALEMAGEGGGWAEGYYIHYWLYEWLFFCEVARRCEGLDYYAAAPKFYRQRALASLFETYPGIGEYNSRRCLPMGDGGGRTFGGDRDKVLSARRILVSHFQDDPVHQAAHAFNETTPRSAVGAYAYKDFLWHNTSVPKGDYRKLPLSHLSAGPGFVYARSSWKEDATCFFFKCGDRFTAHQHLDLNHFLIYKHAELAGDGGQYDDFGSEHDVNYHLRTIAHSTILVLDPEEKWPGIRAGNVTANDGGQHHNWKHHNGATSDPADWLRQKAQVDIGDMLAFEDHGPWLHVAGDATRAYSARKLNLFTRQVVFARPNTFIIFDRVKSTRPEFKKTWLLQAMRPPETSGKHLVITNGPGRLFVQTLWPQAPEVRLVSGDDLYRIGGKAYPPRREIGQAPQCRIEVSPREAAAEDLFVHVLTAGQADTPAPEPARASLEQGMVTVEISGGKFRFGRETVSCDKV